MIHDLSATLEAILVDPTLGAEYPELAAATIVFARPDATFVPPQQSAVDLFLYEIKENLELRNNQPVVRRQNGLATVSPPPRRIDCSYLVTAWPQDPVPPTLEMQEHRLLGQALQVLGRYPTIPEQFVQGGLRPPVPPAPPAPPPVIEPPLPMLAPAVNGLKSVAEFWTAMGNQVRASFTVTATISMSIRSDVTWPIVSTTRAGIDVGGGVDETLIGIGGEVRANAAAGSGPVADALVDIVDAGLRVRTDADGRFRFERVPA